MRKTTIIINIFFKALPLGAARCDPRVPHLKLATYGINTRTEEGRKRNTPRSVPRLPLGGVRSFSLTLKRSTGMVKWWYHMSCSLPVV